MIKLIDIRRACNDVLKANYPSIPVKSYDVQKGFERPSFALNFGDIQTQVGEDLIMYNLPVNIYYFQNLELKDYTLMIDEVRFDLPLIFGNKLKVLDRYLNIDETEAVITDEVVVFTFNLLFYQDNPKNDEMQALYMEHLTINGKEVV